ncbi:hypothetical protein A0J61_04740 [Choanephora cucurbitarum]|uniref:Uncharacterized protein n=1 Tax=Choanephora cucurbitarum TaxID=101091 RepID=A0A1C7NDR7_9FUNG|nr:hypothetical protein A0J61_04740 [Choanephora cucurbitarum]
MSETELMLKLWADIVDVQAGVMNLKYQRGEILNAASAERRFLFAVEDPRKPMGKRANLIVKANNTEVGYGVASLGSDNSSKKNTFDSKMKTCKALKDMFDSNYKRVDGNHSLLSASVYVGFQFSSKPSHSSMPRASLLCRLFSWIMSKDTLVVFERRSLLQHCANFCLSIQKGAYCFGDRKNFIALRLPYKVCPYGGI